jgi:hypothetical protein
MDDYVYVALGMFLLIVAATVLMFNAGQKEERTLMDVVRDYVEVGPNETVTATWFSSNQVQSRLRLLREQYCDNLSVDDYWVVTVGSTTLWVDESSNSVVCIVEEGVQKITAVKQLTLNVTEPFGILRERDYLEHKQGDYINEPIYFYNLGGKDTTYIHLNITEYPRLPESWMAHLEPPAHMYTVIGTGIEVIENVHVEPSEPLIEPPGVYPDDEAYIQIPGISGYVRANPVTLKAKIPRGPVVQRELGPLGRYNITLVAIAKRLNLRGEMEIFETETLNCTIFVE